MIDLRLGDCLDVMAAMEPNSVDTVITDPPYGLAFMGKDWDHGVPGAHFWQEVLRVCKPGAMLLAFGGTRTFHRLTCAIEDAGWEIRDVMMWLYGSGFPKSHNLAVAFDKQNGMPHRGIGFTTAGYTPSATVPGGAHGPHSPSSDMGKVWQGYGTALKPAWEPIILAMKPLDGTFAQNAEKWGVAGLNVDGARIGTNGETIAPVTGKGTLGGTSDGWDRPWKKDPAALAARQERANLAIERANTLGRWPANLILDEDAAKALDEQSGETGTGKRTERMTPANRAGTYSGFEMCSGAVNAPNTYPDTGGASRFFYVAKASRAEREAGLEGVRNFHPTIKPLALMRYLCKLTATPTGGVVLDPFMGSGTTGIAAVYEGRSFVGIEKEAEYLDIARRRIAYAEQRAGLKMQNELLPEWAGEPTELIP